MTLASPSYLSVISGPLDGGLVAIADKIEHTHVVEGRGDVEALLCRLLETPVTGPRSLDLIGHSSNDRSLLRLGDWILDPRKHTTTAFFRELADNDVLLRLGIDSVRLLGCETAATPDGRALLRVLSEILELEVFGSRDMLGAMHYDACGFRDEIQGTLVSSRQVENYSVLPVLHGEPFQRTLDVDALPASPVRPRAWTSRIATPAVAATVLRLIQRNLGAYMTGLDPVPQSEICLPSATRAGWYYVLQIVLDGSFVRVFPDAGGPGVVFPVSDPMAFRELVRELPRLDRE